ncbi:MAG: HlyD family efflux transporter periplasmic adaptor subunit [Verrucomicrobiota bacterium]
MSIDSSSSSSFKDLIGAFEECRKFAGKPADFWSTFASALSLFPSAATVRILTQSSGSWKVLTTYPVGRGATHSLTQEAFEALCGEADTNTYAQSDLQGREGHLLLVRLGAEDESARIYAEISLSKQASLHDDSLAGVFALVADTPRAYERNLREHRVQQQLDDTARALEVLAAVNACREFTPASMALVNEVATRFNSNRVTLGWVSGYYVKSVAMSVTDRFERKVEVVQRLEAAMEESRDQEEEIIFPAPQGSEVICRAHEAYAQESHVGALISVPLRLDGDVCAILTLEREQGEFALEDALGLRVVADQAAPVLYDLKKKARWFGHRWADRVRDLAAKAVGPRHTWMKVGAIALSVFLFFALFVPYTYRVKANFIIVPDRLALLPVPFNGFIEDVYYQPGDLIEAGSVLMSMDDGELEVERVRAIADLSRYRAEAEQAEAQGEMGNFRVANELAGQAAARLQLAEYRLKRAKIRAPFNGVLVEGDLRDQIGAPVDQGEVLMKFSRLDGLSVEVDLPERDIDLLDGSMLGQIAFASRPDLKFPVEIERIEPSAVAGQGVNFFVIRAVLKEAEIEWLRPGMTGVARLDAGKRTLAWRASHRLVDFLRMFFWF